MNYRIIEEDGFFYIEVEHQLEVEKHTFLTKALPFIFKPKIEIRKSYFKIDTNLKIMNLFSAILKFNTKKEAKKFIYKKIKPKTYGV